MLTMRPKRARSMVGQHRLRALDGGAEIDGDHLVEGGEIDLTEFLNMIEAGIVDEPGHLVAALRYQLERV